MQLAIKNSQNYTWRAYSKTDNCIVHAVIKLLTTSSIYSR